MGRRIPLAHEKVSKRAANEDGARDYEVDYIGKRRVKRGVVEFLTLWKCYRQEDATWEPMGSFIHRYSGDLVKYARENWLGDWPVLMYLSAQANETLPPRGR